MISLVQLANAWQRFFHAPEPVGALCLFRVLFGLILVVNALTMLPFAADFFGPRGLLVLEDFAKAYPSRRLSLFYWLPATDGVARGMVIALALAAGCLAMGLFTVVAAPMAWLVLVSLHHRNPAIFNSGDSVQRLLLLLLCFTPSGAALSVDSWLLSEASRRQAITEREATDEHELSRIRTGGTEGREGSEEEGKAVRRVDSGEDSGAGKRERTFDPWAMRLMQIQICIVYLRSVYWKLRGKPWREGTAVAYVLQAMSFRRWSAPRVVLQPVVYRSLAYGTILIETYIPLAVWVKELRWSAIIAGCVLHLTLDMFLNVHLFGPTMCAGLMLFVPLVAQ